MLEIAIKATNYLSIFHLLSHPNHLKFFSLMCGLLLLSLIMILSIMSSLSITLQSLFSFIHLSKSPQFIMYLFNLSLLWKNTLIVKSIPSSCKVSCYPRYLSSHHPSLLSLTTLNTMVILKEVIVIFLNLVFPFFVMPFFLLPFGLMPLPHYLSYKPHVQFDP